MAGNSIFAPENPGASPIEPKCEATRPKVEPGEALGEGPLKAETFPVSVEKQYLVVEV